MSQAVHCGPERKVNAGAAALGGISAVLPALDEVENIGKAALNLSAALEALPLKEWEIIIVDDGSTDGTGAAADRIASSNARIRVLHHASNLGYGPALKTGICNARHALVFFMDSDNQFDAADIGRLFPLIGQSDIVCGYRISRSDSFFRHAFSRAFNFVSGMALGIDVRDINCAFKLFRKDAFDSLDLECRDFLINAEFLARARRSGCRISEVGVPHYARTAGSSTVRPRHLLSTLSELARIWLRIRH